MDIVMKESKVNLCRSFTGGVKKGQGLKPTTHPQLVLWLRMCGAIPLLAPYAFMVYKETNYLHLT